MATHTDTQTTPTHAALVAELLREGQTAHQWALCRRHVVRGDFPACTQAIAQFPDLLHMVDPLDLCSLLHVAVGAQNLDIVKELLRLGAGHQANRVGSTPLHVATLFDSLEVMSGPSLSAGHFRAPVDLSASMSDCCGAAQGRLPD
eukprot:m.318190 g.318190  ORF g.318190 m.318190 type:complete len:146 (-) comp55485_c0_seq5:894-1331(-)